MLFRYPPLKQITPTLTLTTLRSTKRRLWLTIRWLGSGLLSGFGLFMLEGNWKVPRGNLHLPDGGRRDFPEKNQRLVMINNIYWIYRNGLNHVTYSVYNTAYLKSGGNRDAFEWRGDKRSEFSESVFWWNFGKFGVFCWNLNNYLKQSPPTAPIISATVFERTCPWWYKTEIQVKSF